MQIHELGDPIPPIPCYTPAPEGPGDALREKYPLQMIGYHTKRRCHSIHDQNPWLEEVDPPALWMHPDDAAARGIANGDMIEVFNDRGHAVVKAFIDEEIVKLAEEKFFHADFDATLKEVYGEAVDPDNLVVEGGVVEE